MEVDNNGHPHEKSGLSWEFLPGLDTGKNLFVPRDGRRESRRFLGDGGGHFSVHSGRPRSYADGGHSVDTPVLASKENEAARSVGPRSAPALAENVAAPGGWGRWAPSGVGKCREPGIAPGQERKLIPLSQCPCRLYASRPKSSWRLFVIRERQKIRKTCERSRSSFRLQESEKACAKVWRLTAQFNRKTTRPQHIKREQPARHMDRSFLSPESGKAGSSGFKALESNASLLGLPGHHFLPSSGSPLSSFSRRLSKGTIGSINAAEEPSTEMTILTCIQKNRALSPTCVRRFDVAGQKASKQRAASAPITLVYPNFCQHGRKSVRALKEDTWRKPKKNFTASRSRTEAYTPVVGIFGDEACCLRLSAGDSTSALHEAELAALDGSASDEMLELESCEPLFAAQEENVHLSLEHFDEPESHGDLLPQEWVRRCNARRQLSLPSHSSPLARCTEESFPGSHCTSNTGHSEDIVADLQKSLTVNSMPAEPISLKDAPPCLAAKEDTSALFTTHVPRHRCPTPRETKAHSAARGSKVDAKEDAYVFHYESGGWRWTKCHVLQYAESEKRFLIRLLEGGQEKRVSRPVLHFVEEDIKKSEERIELCRRKKERMRLRQALINTIRSLPDENFSQMSSRTQQHLLRRTFVKRYDLADRCRRAKLLRRLLLELEDLHKFAMKFSSIKQKKITLYGTPYAFLAPEIQRGDRFGQLFRSLLPARVKQFGCTRLPDTTRPFAQTVVLLKKNPLFYRASVCQLMLKINTRFFEVKDFRFLDVNRGRNRKHYLPGVMYRANHRMTNSDPLVGPSMSYVPSQACSVENFVRHQRDHCCDVKDALAEHWIGFVHNEIMATVGAMGKSGLFYVEDLDKHLNSSLHKMLKKVRLLLSHQMAEFIDTSIRDWKHFFLSFVEDGKHVMPEALLVLRVAMTRNEVSLVPPPEELPGKVNFLLEWLVEQANSIMSLEKDLLPFLKTPQVPLYSLAPDYAPLVETKKCIEEILNSCVVEVDRVISTFRSLAKLLLECVADVQPGDISVAQLRARLQKLHDVLFTVRSICPSQLRVRLLAVDCARAIEALVTKAENIRQETCSRISCHITDEVSRISTAWEDLHTKILSIPANEAELSALKQLIASLNERTDPLTEQLKTVHELIDLLADFGYSVDSVAHEKAFKAYGWPLQIKFDMLETTNILEQGKLRFQAKLDRDKTKLEAELTDYQEALKFVKESMTDLDQAIEYNKKILQLKQNLLAANTTVTELTNAEILFGVEPSDYSGVHDLINEFEPLRQLWSLAVDFKYAEYQWMNCSITTLDPNEIEACVDNWYREACKLKKDFAATKKEKQILVTDALRQAIDNFRRRLPLIRSLCNGAFQPRHWNDLLLAIDSPLEIEEGFSLSQLLESGIQNHMDLVEEKSGFAQKEFGLKNALLKMKSEWKSTQITLMPYKQPGEYVIKGFDAIQQLLEDHLMRTQSMRGLRYIKCVEHQSREWETKLLEVQQLFSSLESFQRSLLYLLPIFNAEDISRQLPGEASLFKRIESCWRRIMQQAIESPGPLEIAEIDDIQHHVSESNAQCTHIARALKDYLETKRLVFPRFFLLSNDELLDILSQAKNPNTVQRHINKCFEGVHTVKLSNDSTSVESVSSCEGEELQLIRPIALKEFDTWKKAETWLGEMEDCLGDTVRSAIEQAVKAYAETNRPDWCLCWPEQVALTVSQLVWTSETTEAIEQAALDIYLEKCNTQLQELVKLVRGPLTELQRLTATTLVAVDVHARDVVEELQKRVTLKTTDFAWLAQMRCYWQLPDSITLQTGSKNRKAELKLEMMHAHLFYGFEYLGNTERLVITPLTDRCYRTLVTAFHLQYGGAPEGPAGTGKTETVKDLAKAAGRHCVVFNCSDGLDYMSIGRIFKGLASSGSWGCFDEFNRIDVDVLSVVAQQVHSIQQAIRNQARVFVFEGTDIKLAPSCTVNVTMNPGYTGRSELPENLKSLFRPCAMMMPDFSLIAEVYLYATGFANARNIAKKVLSCLKLSSQQLSEEKHYDFGMRSLKAILRAAARLKQQHGDHANEDALALFAVEKTTLGKLAPADSYVFGSIVADLFLDIKRFDGESPHLREHLVNAVIGRGLQPTESFLTKCIQLWDTVRNRHGLMVLGVALSGKTMVWECLAGALESLSTLSTDYLPCTMYTINPKSLTLEQLYGMYDASTQDWTDGIVALTTRTAAQQNSNRQQWIIFDGPVDTNWIENMNTVLDDNRKLCLTSGEIIKLSPVTTLLFEVEDLSSVSPATVSRCGMVYMDQNVLGWRPLLQSWLEQKLALRSAAHVPFVQAVADQTLPVLFEFFRTNCEKTVQASENWLLLSMLRLYEAFLASLDLKNNETAEKDLRYVTENLFLSTIIWTVGVCLEEKSRSKFNNFFRKLVTGQPELATEFTIVEATYYPRPLAHSIPKKDTVYDYFFDGSAWVPIAKLVPQLTLSRNANVHSILVPTTETTQIVLFLQKAIRGGLHVLLAGPTGTGKTTVIASQLKNGFEATEFTSLSLCLSARSTANDTQDVIDAKMDRSEGGSHLRTAKRQCLIFLDDINLPVKDQHGSQPVIELLRQCLSSGGWYDRKTWRFKQLRCLQLLAAMDPLQGGAGGLSKRFLHHFNALYLIPLHRDSIEAIYCTLLRLHFSAFSTDVQKEVENLTKCIVEVHDRVCTSLIATPSRPHYVFSLRDLTRVTLGLCACSAESLQTSSELYKCGIHECERVYFDRLICKADREALQTSLQYAVEAHMKRKHEDILCGDQPLLFCNFVDAQKAIYQQHSLADIKQAAVNYLHEYNRVNIKRPLNLVFFRQAAEHLTRTVRILCQPCGNALLIGIGGSGRKTLTKLAAFIAGHDLCTVQLTASYTITNWREDIKGILIKAGCHLRNVTFMLADTQVDNEGFLQDTASMLSCGEVPNIFSLEDKIGISDILSHSADDSDSDDTHVPPPFGESSVFQAVSSSIEAPERAELFSTFVANCQQHLHIVLLFSPSGAALRQRLQMYPALINCCTVDWYDPWSKSALQEVAEAQLQTICLKEQISLPKICQVSAEMQLDVAAVSLRFDDEMNRFFFVTPTSYRELLSFFEELSVKKKEAIQKQQHQFSSGLEKLERTSAQVTQIRLDLELLKPQLKQASTETASLMASIEKMQKEAAATKATVQAEEAVCNQQATNAARVKEQCHEELEQAMPALLVAIEALKKLSKADITELNSLKSPPSGVVKVMVALCKMFSIAPLKLRAPDGFSKVEDYWTAAKKHLLSDTRLLQKLLWYDKDNIPAEQMRDIAPYLKDPDFNPDVIRKASVAATSLCKWVRAIVLYDQVARNVEPKRAALKSAEAALAVAAKKLEIKKVELREVETLVDSLLDEQRAAQAKKDMLKRQCDDCNAKLQVAERLLGDLASERERWTASFNLLKEKTETLLGELLLISGVITYGGVFTNSYRQQCIAAWLRSLTAGGISAPTTFDFQRAMGEPLQIQQWVCNFLPNDSISIDNAIILSHSRRWPMLIDPQKQATRWLKKSIPAIKVLRASDRNCFNQLKAAIEMGLFVFLEHCSDALDPALDPILARAVFKTGSISVIRLQEVNIEYAVTFKLYLATNLPNPHFTPEVCAELTLLNFSVTLEGLEDQLLNAIISLENPDVEAKRQALLAESATNKQQLMALEEKILLLLSDAKGNVLDDTELLGALNSSKLAAQGIASRVTELERTQEVMLSTRAGYESIANRAAKLYDVLVDLGFVEEMYQFSAEWYIAVFTQAIKNAKTTGTLADGLYLRLEQVDKQFLVLLYENVCRSLFARHKFVFSLMLAFKVMALNETLNSKQLQVLLKGGATSSGSNTLKPPQADWLPDVAWERLVELEEAGGVLKNISTEFSSNLQEWKSFLDEPDPAKLDLSGILQAGVTDLERCLVIQALRPDCLVKCMKTLVEDCLGSEFLEPPPFDLLYSYKSTTQTTPLLFMLASGEDPMEEVLKLAQRQRTKNKLRFISLGQGQGQRAAAAIESAVETGGWTLLQNCHLGFGFLPHLERIIEDLPFQDVHPDFRLLLTSMPTPAFPVSILLNSVKITSETPRGLRPNLQKTYRSFDAKFVAEHPKPEAWRKLLFGVSFFHALVTERRRFGPLGWNVSYEFSQNDFYISVQQLRQLLADLDPIPWDVLKYLIAEINYGGRITDPWDRRLINSIVEDIYNPQILEDDYKLCEAEDVIVKVPAMFTVENYRDFIEDLPNSESPEYNSLHPNADLTVAIAEGSAILHALLSSKPKSSGKANNWTFADPTDIARVLEEQLPCSIEFRAAQRRYSILFKETLLPVLLQELTRFNRLLAVTHKHIKAYQDAAEGRALLTPALEEFGSSLINNRVPQVISAVAYPSLKSLSSWVKDLLEKLEFFRMWLTLGPPSVYWISAFFLPQSFLTAVLRNHARAVHVPVDEIDFDFEVLPYFGNTGENSGNADQRFYIHGLYMDGARWSREEQVIAEPFARILYYEMPIIWLKPIEICRQTSEAHLYECPVYRTPARGGNFSTSGIATNYILAVDLPIGRHHPPTYWRKRGVALLAQLNE